MTTVLCRRCKGILTEENSSPIDLKRKAYCRECHRFYNNQSYKKFVEERKERSRKYRKDFPDRVKVTTRKCHTSFVGRFNKLKQRLKQDGISQTDLLWNVRFYVELVRDGICHYCLRPLNPYGHALDRIDNSKGHEAANVVPCCRQCNRIKGEFWEYEHMMLLAPKLRNIQQENVDGSSNDNSGGRS